MAQGVRRDVCQARLFTDAIKHAHHADKMALAPIRREEVGRFRLWLTEQQFDGGAPDHPSLRAALGVREPDRLFFLIQPCALQSQSFHAPKSSEQQEADGRKPGRVLTLLGGGAERLAQPLDLGAAEAPLAGLRGKLSNALGGIGFDPSEARGMLEDGVERRHGARRDAFAAGRGSATAADTRLRRLTRGDVGLRTLDVAELQRADLPAPEQRFDVGLDTAPIHRQGGRLDGAPAPAEDAPGLGLGDVPVADFGDGQESRRLCFFGDRVDALGHGDELLVGDDAGPFDGHQPVASDDHPPGAALGGAVLDDEALEARGHDLHAEAAQLAIPEKTLPNLDPNLRRFRSLQGVHGTLGKLFPSHISHLPELCLEFGDHTPPRSTFQALQSKSRGRSGIQTAGMAPVR